MTSVDSFKTSHIQIFTKILLCYFAYIFLQILHCNSRTEMKLFMIPILFNFDLALDSLFKETFKKEKKG